MKTLPHILAITALTLGTGLHAQTVYRCGNSYSQHPCPGGNALDASDSRTPEQRKAHEASVRHEKQSADSLEKNRQKEEAAVARATEQAQQAERSAAAHAAQKPAASKSKHPHAKDKLPAYRAPPAQGQK